MSYVFTFDLSMLPRSFFKEVAEIAGRKMPAKASGKKIKELARKYDFFKKTSLTLPDGYKVIRDLIDVTFLNFKHKARFLKMRKKALLLPHCSRKYMDHRCKAKFDAVTSSYSCMHCSPDCQVHKAARIGKKKHYDVYILPGGSCLKKILAYKKYQGVMGIACSEEMKLANTILRSARIPVMGLPLTRNGCANTLFDLDLLEKSLA